MTDIYERIRLLELQANDLMTAIRDYRQLITDCRNGISFVPPPPPPPPPPQPPSSNETTNDYATSLIQSAREDIQETIVRTHNLIQKNDVKDANINNILLSLQTTWLPRFERAVAMQFENDQASERVSQMATALTDFQDRLDQIDESGGGKLPATFIHDLVSFANQ